MIYDDSEFNNSEIPLADLAAKNWICVSCESAVIDPFTEKDHHDRSHIKRRLSDSEMLEMLKQNESQKKPNSEENKIEQRSREISRLLSRINERDDHGHYVLSDSQRCVELLKFTINKIIKIENSGEYIAVVIDHDGGVQQINLSSESGIHWAIRNFNKIEQEVFGEIFFKNIINKIIATSEIHHEPVHNRTAFTGDVFYYNLGKKIVRITYDKREIVDVSIDYPIFRPGMYPQVEPNFNADRIAFDEFASCFGLVSDDTKVLKIALVASFLPHIMTHGLAFDGSANLGKSTSVAMIKMLIDRSGPDFKTNRFSISKDLESFQLSLSQCDMFSIDNLSFLNQEESDVLCRAITGGGDLRRTRFKDLQLTAKSYQTKIVLNGVSPNYYSFSDLSDRLIRFSRISNGKFISTRNLEAKIKKLLPDVLGFIFKIIQKIVFIPIPENYTGQTRSPDYEFVGNEIGKLLGIENFVELLVEKLGQSARLDVEGSPVAQFLISKMENSDKLEQLTSELFQEFKIWSSLSNSETKFATIAGFSKSIKSVSTVMGKINYRVTVGPWEKRDSRFPRGSSVVSVERLVGTNTNTDEVQQKLNVIPEQKLEEKPDITQTHFVCLTHRAGPWKTTDKTRSGSILAFHQKCELKFINESELDGIWEREK